MHLQEFTGWILKVLFGSYFSDVVYIDYVLQLGVA